MKHAATFRSCVLVAITCIAIVSACSPVAHASKAVIGTFGSPNGEGNGQLDEPRGIAVNQTGAGGVGVGDVYVVDQLNGRIDEFSASGSFVRSFGYDVVGSGPDNSGVNEKQTVAIEATGGTFTVSVTRNSYAVYTEGSNVISHVYAPTSDFHVGDRVSGGVPAGTTVAAVGTESLVLSAAATSSGRVELVATETTAPIAYNVNAAGLEAALAALPAIGAGNLGVNEGSPGTFTLEYHGALSHNVAFHTRVEGQGSAITTDSSSLIGAGHTASITTIIPGGGFEVCDASNGDVCKAAPSCNYSFEKSVLKSCTESADAGAFDGPLGVAVDQKTGAVYVEDVGGNFGEDNNNRINIYSAKGLFELTFGYDVVASGPDNLAPSIANERQELEVVQQNDSGTFKLTFNSQTTAPIAYNATATEIRAALEAIASIGAGNVEVTTMSGDSWLIEFTGTLGGKSQPQIVGDFSGLSAGFGSKVETTVNGGPHPVFEVCRPSAGDVCQRGIGGVGAGQLNQMTNSSNPFVDSNGDLYVPENREYVNARLQEFAPTIGGGGEVVGMSFVRAIGWDVVETGPDNVVPVDEVQQLTIPPSVTGGTFTLTFEGRTTSALSFKVSRGGLFGALEKLTHELQGSVLVVGKGTGVWELTFRGSLENTTVPLITVDSSGLIGGEAAISELAKGVGPQEVCDLAAHPTDVCKAGVEGVFSGNHLGQFYRGGPTSVTVDSTGSIYATGQLIGCSLANPCGVLRLDPAGHSPEMFAPAQLFEESGAIGLDEGAGSVNPSDVAIDPATDDLLVAKKESADTVAFLEFDGSGAFLGRSPSGDSVLKTPTSNSAGYADTGGLAIGTAGRVYFSNELGMIDVLGPPPPPTVAIASVSDVGAATATFHGTVTPPPPGGEGESFDTTYHFEYSSDGGEHWSRFPAKEVDVGDGSGAGNSKSCPVDNPPTCEVEQTVEGLEPDTSYQVRLVASTGTSATSASAQFETGQAAPTIASVSAEEVGQSSAKLTAVVNPNKEATSYRFEWGETPSYGEQSALASAGEAGEAVAVTVPIAGLKDATSYHYRLVATNASGTSESSDREIFTLDGFGLPDGRAPEQVSPNDKRPVGSVESLPDLSLEFQASENGEAAFYTLLNGLPGATAGGNVEYVSTRGQPSWMPTQMTPPSLVPPIGQGTFGAQTGRVVYASANLDCELIESHEPLTEDTPQADVEAGVTNLYRRGSDGAYTLLTAPVPTAGSPEYKVDGVSRDCAHILFETGYRLIEEAPANGVALYEWNEGQLRLAGIRPDEAAIGGESLAIDAKAGSGNGQFNTEWGSMSSDGSRVFFSATSHAGADAGRRTVFVRSDGTSTVDVAQSQTATPNHGAEYQLASADGSHVFFLANYGLTPTTSPGSTNNCASSGSGGEECDLYEYDTNTSTLTDLSADPNPADVKGAAAVGVLDSSDDGSYVYFAARGQLIAKQGASEAENLAGAGGYNVYLSHDGSLSYVGPITSTDASNSPGGGGDMSSRIVSWVADATPDGKYLLFVSTANVTGYISGSASTLVTEVYRYSAADKEVVCVSCRPDGQPSIGNAATQPLTPNLRAAERLRVRSISDDGKRVFFTMPDVLAPGASAATQNIYEWSAGHVYLLLPGEPGSQLDVTRLIGSSASGDDVFVVTRDKLVGQDFDNTPDLYDLRAPHVPGEKIGPEAVVPPPPPCDPLAGECQPAAQLLSDEVGGAASETFAGPGNQPALVAVCARGYVSEHGKCVSTRTTTRKACRKGYVRVGNRCVKHKAKVRRRHRRGKAPRRRRPSKSSGRTSR